MLLNTVTSMCIQYIYNMYIQAFLALRITTASYPPPSHSVLCSIAHLCMTDNSICIYSRYKVYDLIQFDFRLYLLTIDDSSGMSSCSFHHGNVFFVCFFFSQGQSITLSVPLDFFIGLVPYRSSFHPYFKVFSQQLVQG